MKQSTPASLFFVRCAAGIFLLLIVAAPVFAQPSWSWARGEGAGSEQEGNAVATDNSGNAYTTGFIKNTVSFGSFNVTAVGGEDLFICKYNSSGTVQWAIGDGGNGDDRGYGIAVDNAGNVYVTGHFMGTATFSGSPNVVLTSSGAKDIFVAKYNSSGALQWAKKAGGSGDDMGLAIATNGTSVFITGFFRNTATFGLLPSITSAGADDIFIAAYNAATGVESWVRQGGGTPNDEGEGIAVDNSGVYVSGYYSNGTCTFQNQTGSLTSNGSEDAFLVKYNLSGNGLWIRRAGSTGNDRAAAVSTNGTDVVIAGYFGATMSFYNNGPAVGTLSNTTNEDAFVAKYDANTGNYSWSRSENGTAQDRATGVAITASGYIFCCGWFQGTLPFGSGPSVTANQHDPYATAYSSTGTFLWGKRATSSDNEDDRAMGIAAMDETVQYVAGWYRSDPLNFDLNSIFANSNSDIFTAKLQCMTTAANAGPDQLICSSSSTFAGNNATFGAGAWSLISGTGTITSPNNRNSTVTGLSVGANVFQWTITNGGCPPSADTVVITVDANPTIANAGPDQTLCASSATLAGNTISTGSGVWSLISGTGNFTSASSPTSGVTGLSVGANTFQWTSSNGVCPSSSDQVIINVDANPTAANAGPDQTICSTTSNFAGNTPVIGSGTWSLVAGTGTIVSPSSPTSVINGLSVGANKFKWTISNGTCPSTVDTVTINVTANPTVANAGPDQTICASSTTLSGNTISTGSGVWSLISGTGNFTSASSPTSGVTGLSVGTNVFQWTSSNGVCPSTSDQVTINVDANPTTANAGPDQTICSSSSTLAGNTLTTGSGLWSVIAGTGNFTVASSPNSAITGLSVGANTFQWTSTNGVCPSTSDQVTINVDANPTTANAGPDQTICASSSTLAGNTLTTGSGVWNLISGTGNFTAASSPTSGVNGLSVGANVFQWTSSNGVCPSTSDQVTINVDANPTTANAGPDQTICASSSTLAGNVLTTGSGLWSVVSGTGNFTASASPNSPVTGLSVGANTFQWTSTNGVCPSTSDQVTINVDANPTTANAGPDQTICASSSTLAGNTLTTGSGVWSLISGTGNFTAASSPTSGVTGLSVGANVFQWTSSNGVCPSTSDQVTIDVDANPTTANAGPDQTICSSTSNLTGNLVITGSGVWSLVGGTGTIVNSSSPLSVVNGLTPGANKFEWTISNGVCPSSSDTITINVDANPTTANAGPDQTICASSATLAGNTISTGSGVWSLILGTGNFTSASSPTSGITGLSVGANVFEWTSSNGVCPSTSDQVIINVDANPTTANAGPDQTICSSSSLLAGNLILNGSGLWSVVSGTANFVSPGSPVSAVTGLSTGANVLQWTSSNGVCPASSDTITINVDANPTNANAGPDQTICAPSSVFAGNTPIVGTGFWALVSGTGIPSIASLSASAVTGLATGGNRFSWTITNGVCPLSSDTITINVDENPSVAAAGTDQTLCANAATLNATIPTTGTGVWTLSSGNGVINAPASATTTLSGLTTGVNVFQWTVTNGVCPASTDQVTIQVDANPDAANAGIDHLLCGQFDTLGANLPVVGTGSWFVISGGASVTMPSSPVSPVSNLSVGINSFEWVISNGVCPATRDTVELIYTLPPSPPAAGPDVAACGNSLVLQGQAPATGNGYWTSLSGLGTISDASDAAATVTNLPDGTYTFTWTTSNSYCVSTPDTTIVSLYAPPSVSVAGDDQLVHTTFTQLNALPVSTGTGTWSFAAGSGQFDDEHDHGTTVREMAPGINVLVWTTSNGVCPASVDTVVIDHRLLVIPSGFSPNQDNVNEQFAIEGLLEYSGVTLEIFNRWGNSVYFSGDYRNDWSGAGRNGETLPDDIYYYILSIPGDQTYTGYIALKRSKP